MKLATTVLRLSLLTMGAMASSLAMANDSGWYVGGSLGQSRATIDDERIIGSLARAGLTTISFKDDDRKLGYKVFGGYQFTKYFALESGYFDTGNFGFNATTSPPGTFSGEMKLKGINLDTVGILPLTDKFSALGRIGVNFSDVKSTFSNTGSVGTFPNQSKRAANYKFGLGVQYDFTPSFGMRVEAERYRINDAIGNTGDIDLISAGLVYRFGKTPAPVQRVTTLEPVAYAPAAAPQEQVAVAPTPQLQPLLKVTLSADSLFDFNKSTVKPEGKQALDTLVADLRDVDFNAIIVTGHTDRIGSHAYNLKLSTRRAEAVKAYLVKSAGIPADKISASGVNGADPVTKPDECKGTKKTNALIACLQPDRRVEVQVTGRK